MEINGQRSAISDQPGTTSRTAAEDGKEENLMDGIYRIDRIKRFIQVLP